MDTTTEAMLTVILSPVAAYMADSSVSVYADERFARAWPGGTGNVKLGA